MPAAFAPGGHWGRIAPSVAVSGILAALTVMLFPPMYSLGKRQDDERRFLRNYRAPNEYEVFASFPMEYATVSHEANDVVFVGDSSLRCDIRTTQFERETGLRAYNLGNAGLIGLGAQTLIVSTYLAHHPKPRLIVLCILPTELAPESVEFRPPEEQEIKSRFLWCFGPGTEDSRPKNSYLYHVRQGFKYVYGVLAGDFEHFANTPVPARGGETFRTLERAVTRERGYWEAPLRRPISSRSPCQDTSADPFKVSDEFKKDFAALTRLLAERGVTMLVRLTPWLCSAREDSPALEAWSADVKSKNPHVIVARPEVLVFDPELFHDVNHLNARGADKFTSSLAAEVRRVLAE